MSFKRAAYWPEPALCGTAHLTKFMKEAVLVIKRPWHGALLTQLWGWGAAGSQSMACAVLKESVIVSGSYTHLNWDIVIK